MKTIMPEQDDAHLLEVKYTENEVPEIAMDVEEFDEDFDKMFLGKGGEMQDDNAPPKYKTNQNRRTFVVSATLGKTFFTSRMMTKKVKSDLKKLMKENPETVPNMKLKEIMKHINFKHKTKVVDMTQETLLPESLEVMKVDCPTEDKMLYLYYFVNLYKDKPMIIFTNSISSSSRIKSLLALASKLNADDRLKMYLSALETSTEYSY